MRKSFRGKIFVLTLAVAMVLSNLTIFADTPSPWAQAEVTEATGKGLVLPEADGHYKEDISRELFCKLIVNMVEITIGAPVTITIANPFTDTSDSDIIKAYQLGIVNGTSATTFAPNDLINREQVAVMMMRAARKQDTMMGHHFTSIMLGGPPTFADLDQISNWALTDVHEANSLGIMNGIGGNKIDPQGKTTIEQSVLLILRVFNEYLPLMENAAPAQLPTAILSYDINEGDSIDIQLADLAYDADGDAIRFNGISGNNTYGTCSTHTDYVTFTPVEVDADQVSVWTITVSDNVESVAIELTFNIKDVPAGNPVSNGVTTFTVNEGEKINISPSDIATDPDGDVMLISSLVLNADYSTEIGETLRYLAFMGSENSMDFTAGPVNGDTTTAYDLTIKDGTNETIITIVINVNEASAPPVANPMETQYQEEYSVATYSPNIFASDPDGDDLDIIAFKLNDDPIYASAQHDLGTGSILNVFGVHIFTFNADMVTASAWTYYDLTISDGLNEIVVTIRIQVNNN